MQDYEIDAWLGDTDTTPEQRTALARISDTLVEKRYPGDDGKADAHDAFASATMYVLGDTTLAEVGDAYLQARAAEQAAHTRLTGAIIAAAELGVSESEISRQTGVTRVTVRRALGK